MLQSEITKLLTVWAWLPQQGLPQALPFIVIMVAMTLLARGVGARGAVGEPAQPVARAPDARRYATTAVCFVVGVDRCSCCCTARCGSAFIASLVSICSALSLVVLTGYVGQVSLAQMSLRGRQRVHAHPPRRRPGHRVPVVAAARRAAARCRSGC